MIKPISRREFIKNSALTCAATGMSGSFFFKGLGGNKDYDMVIAGGILVDGSGAEARKADIAVLNGRIAEIGRISASHGRKVIDARNLIVCPGFIDAHDHSDMGLLVNPKAESHIRQGITTLVSGNCGSSPFPLSDAVYEEMRDNLKNAYNIDLDWKDITGFFQRIEKKGTALNYSSFVGQGTVRGAVMGYENRPPEPKEMAAMRKSVQENIRKGALGLSSGLEYAPGSYAGNDEIASLCRAAAGAGGLYSTHMRDEGDFLLESLEETIMTARQAGTGLQISHLKCAYPRNWNKIDRALDVISQAGDSGVDIFCDRYPYVAGATSLSSLNFPLWAQEGGTDDFLERLKDPSLEEKLRSYLKQREEKLGSWEKVVISSVASKKNRRFEGRSIQDCAETAGKDVFVFLRDLLIEERDQVGMILFMMSEDNLKKILRHPLVGVGCDGSVRAPYGPLSLGKPHPRNYGSFPRVIAEFIRKEKILPLPEMIRKMTAVPASRFGFIDRGMVKKGCHADLVLFDFDKIKDKATYQNPHQYPEGIPYVIVNGRLVIEEEEHTGRLPGRVLRSRDS
ncbi:MAG: D-aminoacylase [Candidatus Aminicenantes bacterium]